MTFTLKQKAGAVVIDWPRYEWHVRGLDLPGLPTGHWTRIGNRRDSLEIGPEGRGVRRAGRWTSRLHVARVFPSLASRLMAKALEEWPIGRSDEPVRASEAPEISFVIGHRGRDRLPHLRVVLETIAAQTDVDLECVVVEQSPRSEIGGELPGWVRVVRNPPPAAEMPYARAWAFNVGARAARGRLLVFHDNDLLVPSGYAAELDRLHRRGSEVIDLKRFVFYLPERETRRWLAADRDVRRGEVAAVLDNARGGSLAVDRAAFLDLGGYDEAFVGWGGEDNEFWERARGRRVWPYGYVPLVHLWHPSQPEKEDRERDTARLLEERSRISAEERVAELSARDFGRPEGLDPAWPA